MNKTILILLACVLSPGMLRAQKQGQALIDSLTIILRAYTAEDTVRAGLLNKLSFACNNINTDDGIAYGMQGLALSNSLGWKKGIAWANNSIAVNYMGKSDYPHALDYYYKALQQYEELGDLAFVSITSGNIGSLYQVQGAYDKALDMYTKALPAARKSGSRSSEITILGGIGNVYDLQHKYPEAIHYLDSAVAVSRFINDYENVARNLGNLADAYSSQKNYPRALDVSFQALRIAAQYGFKTLGAVTLGNIGETYLTIAKDPSSGIDAGALKHAIAYLDSGVAACKAISYLAPMTEFSERLSEAYTLNGDYRSALASYRSFVTYKDSVYSNANKIKITKLETQRAIELKNKQIELDRLAVEKKRNERGFFVVGIGLLLAVIGVVFRNYRVQKSLNGLLSIEKKKVEEHTEELDATNKELNTTLVDLKETQQQLIVAEKQKENEMIRSRISQDIHDDISSELTRISWVSELAKAKVKKDDYKDMPGLLEKITDSSRETVMKLGEIIWTVNPENDSLASLLAYMRAHITKFFADTQFSYGIDFPEAGTDVHINPELKRNLYLVMKEALNNVVKYSGAAQVNISLQLDGGAYFFCVRDDGKGIEEGVVQGGGNGLGNMRRRMENVQGMCTITSEPDKGTCICCSGALY